MYDVLVKSVIFGTRNADKIINQGDTGRIFADMGQWTNAVNAVTKLDNTVGKGAKTAINAMAKASESNKALSIAGKGLNWASKNVNPLLIGAAGYRVCKAEDKEAALQSLRLTDTHGTNQVFTDDVTLHLDSALKAEILDRNNVNIVISNVL